MTERVAHWIAQSWDELRLIAPYAAAALVSGGSVSSVMVALVWLFQHRHHTTEPRT
ncbi:MAG TPA: hypothetical protein VGI35_00335 [Steroidobacteraceae bacterium]|jgi:hypothetical protein